MMLLFNSNNGIHADQIYRTRENRQFLFPSVFLFGSMRDLENPKIFLDFAFSPELLVERYNAK